ncbi:MAG: hypothetical protein ACOZQL_25475 [Myxococcota bacterium]
MHITNGEVRLTAAHERVESHRVEEHLEAWGAPPVPSERVSLEAARSDPERAPLDVKRLILERVFGVEAPEPVSPPDTRTSEVAAPPRAGFGVVFERVEEHVEHEHLAVQARGRVQTADGRDLELSLVLEQTRSVVVRDETQLRLGDARRVDPLALDLDGGGVQLADSVHAFDLDADGAPEQIHQLAGRDAWLGRDLNGDGTIGDGRELFGPTSGDGFAELSALDSDGDGFLDEDDAAFSALRLWSPRDGTLSTLAEAGVGALALARVTSPFTLAGGALRETGVYLREDGLAGALQHVDLEV